MRLICQKLRIAFVALLSVALLVGPCLSFVGAFGISPVHAHAGVSQKTSHGAAASHAHAQHGAHSAAHDQKEADPIAPHHPSPLSCEELCEGWALKKSPRDWAISNSSDSGETPILPRLFALKTDFLPALRHLRRPPEPADMAALPPSLAAYHLTGRFRL